LGACSNPHIKLLPLHNIFAIRILCETSHYTVIEENIFSLN
jgi:hypothetical protein